MDIGILIITHVALWVSGFIIGYAYRQRHEDKRNYDDYDSGVGCYTRKEEENEQEGIDLQISATMPDDRSYHL